MSTRYRFGDNAQPHFVTFAVVNWVDALSRAQYKDVVVDGLRYCIENKGLLLHAWILMNNHVHLIISSKENRLEYIMRDLKRHTSKSLLEMIGSNNKESRREWMMWLFRSAGEKNSNNENYQFWEQDNHPIILPNIEILNQKLDYIHYNPVKAAITFAPEYYVYSSAVNYYTDAPGLLPVEVLR